MDYTEVQKQHLSVGGAIEETKKAIQAYEANKSLIDSLIGFILNFFKKKKKEVPQPPAPTPGVPTMPSNQNSGQVYFRLHLKCFFLEGDRKGGGGGPIYSKQHFDEVLSEAGTVAQMVGERMHFDLTPYDKNGNEIGPDDSRHPIVPGDVPVRGLWTSDGEVQTDTGHDKFNWESVLDDHGCTPVLNLETESTGRVKCTLQMRILAEHNGGVEVPSNVVTWYSN